MHAPDGTVIRGPERRQSPRTVGKPGSWGEQISDSDFPAESAARFPQIVGVCVRIWAGADGDDGNGDDGNGDDGNGDAGDGDDGDGDGVGDGDHSTRST